MAGTRAGSLRSRVATPATVRRREVFMGFRSASEGPERTLIPSPVRACRADPMRDVGSGPPEVPRTASPACRPTDRNLPRAPPQPVPLARLELGEPRPLLGLSDVRAGRRG